MPEAMHQFPMLAEKRLIKFNLEHIKNAPNLVPWLSLESGTAESPIAVTIALR